MTISIHQYLCLTDNYGVLAHDSTTGATACVDIPEAGATLAALAERGWNLTDILVTHHHADHTDGIMALKAKHSCRVVAPREQKAKDRKSVV